MSYPARAEGLVNRIITSLFHNFFSTSASFRILSSFLLSLYWKGRISRLKKNHFLLLTGWSVSFSKSNRVSFSILCVHILPVCMVKLLLFAQFSVDCLPNQSYLGSVSCTPLCVCLPPPSPLSLSCSLSLSLSHTHTHIHTHREQTQLLFSCYSCILTFIDSNGINLVYLLERLASPLSFSSN